MHRKNTLLPMNHATVVLLALGIVVGNNLIGHFFPPSGLTLTPVVVMLVAALIGFGLANVRPVWKSVLLAGMLSLHDIGIKLFAGGRHDREGQGWIMGLFWLGLVPGFGLLVTALFGARGRPWWEKWGATLLFPVLIALEQYLTAELGLGRSYAYEWNTWTW